MTRVSPEVRAERQAFVEARVEEFTRAGKKLPRGYREAFKSTSPTAKAYNNIVSFSANRGLSGGWVAEEWMDPVLGRYRFTACVGPRPHHGLATNSRRDPKKPWGPGNFKWRRPKGQAGQKLAGPSINAAERMHERKALATMRREHVAFLIEWAELEYGVAIPSEAFARNSETNPVYSIWYGLTDRCENPENADYPNYGGRGLEVDALFSRYINEFGFEDYVFYVYTCPDLGERPGPEYSTERKNVDLGYVRENLTWALPEVQHANRREVVKRGMTKAERAKARLAEVGRTWAIRENLTWAMIVQAGLAEADEGSDWEIGEDGFPMRHSCGAKRNSAEGQP